MSEHTDVIVVGGGLGGLLVACEVLRRGGRPLILEAGPRAGGVAATVVDNGYLLEPAAGSFLLPNPYLTPLLAAAGATVIPATDASHRRYVFNRGTLYELAGPAAVATGLVSLRGKLRLLGERWVRPLAGPSDESLRSFFERRLGPEVGLLVATLMAHGVFAGDPDRLSARAAFPALVELEDSAGSLTRGAITRMRSRPKGTPRSKVHVAPNGMAGLTAELVAYLGDCFRPNCPVDAVCPDGNGWVVSGPTDERAPAVVVALSPSAATAITPEPLSAVLREAHAAPVAIVGLGGPSADLPLPSGFGALIGPQTDLRALGLLFESSYALGRAPKGHRLLKGIYGGAADPSVMALTDQQLVELAVAETAKVIGVMPQPSWTRVVRHDQGIPQYDTGHVAWLSRLDDATGALSGLHLAGWGYRGIGVSSLAKHASQLADTLLHP
ncbi:MAG TPA: protoporphyrinogen oxidase [Ilumatobacteraceae bacterium]|nr:protoporphyrinogen oxidase [Ilumatobacteraceae bacterium]HRB02563.1 protoporphyrinogen oxidase [Ilumatobacteraceae bacterium]